MARTDARAGSCPALGGSPGGAGQLGPVPPTRCASTTYVPDHAPAGWLRGNRRRSSAIGNGPRDVAGQSSQAGHKKERIKFCRVTTRPAPAGAACPETRPRRQVVGSPRRPRHVAGRAVPSRPRHGIDALPVADAVVVAVWRLANGVEVFGSRGLGNTVGSTAGPGRPHGIPCAGRSGGQDVDRWSNGIDRDYAVDVPREGLLPNGPPERSIKSLGHLFLISSPLAEMTVAIKFTSAGVRDHPGSSPAQPPAQAAPRQNDRKTNKQPVKLDSRKGKETEGRRQGRRPCGF
jgi:hypothetical protein